MKCQSCILLRHTQYTLCSASESEWRDGKGHVPRKGTTKTRLLRRRRRMARARRRFRSSKHMRSSVIPRDCISACTPTSWHNARAGAGGSALEGMAPASLEKCVNSMEASGLRACTCAMIGAVPIIVTARIACRLVCLQKF